MDKTKHASPSTEAADQQPTQMAGDRAGLLAGASVTSAVLASACCIVPLALFSLGIGGAWMANLTALAPYQPFFVVLAGALILSGFISMRHRRSCDLAARIFGTPLMMASSACGTGVVATSTVTARQPCRRGSRPLRFGHRQCW